MGVIRDIQATPKKFNETTWSVQLKFFAELVDKNIPEHVFSGHLSHDDDLNRNLNIELTREKYENDDSSTINNYVYSTNFFLSEVSNEINLKNYGKKKKIKKKTIYCSLI